MMYCKKTSPVSLKTIYETAYLFIPVIENINTHRGEQSLEAMYLLMPTSQNVDRIIADFAEGRRRYGGAHLFFIDGLPEPLLNHLVNSPAEPHLRTLQDLYVNFAAIEQRVFSIRSPGSFFNMYAPHKEVPATTFNPRRAEAAQMSPMQVAVRGAREGLDNELRFMAKSVRDTLESSRLPLTEQHATRSSTSAFS